MSLFLAGLAFLAAFVLICLSAMRVFQGALKTRIEERFRAADAIVNDHRVPATWLKASRARRGAGPEDEVKAQALCLGKLDELTRYFRTSPFVDGEESREVLLQELQAAREAWEKGTWAEMWHDANTEK